MNRIITMLLHDRANYTSMVIEALRNCTGVEKYTLFFHIEPGCDEVIAIANAVNFCQTEIIINSRILGVSQNTFQAWRHGFSRSEFIIHIEDDTVPAKDCLLYMEYCAKQYARDDEVFSVAAYNKLPCKSNQYYQISRRRFYSCWIVGTWGNRWEWIKKRWSQNSDTYAVHLEHTLARFELFEIFPLLSRSQNIGVENGTHVPSLEWHRQNQHTDYWAGTKRLRTGQFNEKKRRDPF